MRTSILGILTTICTVAACASAGAQTTTGDGVKAGELEEVVVTAEKRAESISRAPAAITALTGAELATFNIQNIVDMTAKFPSARFEDSGYSTHLYVRGVGSEQDRISVDQLVAMSVDGVPLPREVAGAAQFDIHDVELLPGPQGTLYGAGAVGGAIIVANNRPVDHYETLGSLQVGNYAMAHVTAVQNVPLNDRLFMRAAVDYSRHSAYETGNHWTGDALNARLSTLFQGGEIFSAYLWGQVTHDDSVPPGANSVTSADRYYANNPWDVTSCSTPACNAHFPKFDIGPPRGRVRNYTLAGELSWKLHTFTLTDIPSLINAHTDNLLYGEAVDIVYDVVHHQLTNELKATSNGEGKLQWIGGLYWLRDHASQNLLIISPTFNLPQFTVETLASFGQATYAVADALRLTAGGRFTWNRKEGTFTYPGPFPSTSANWHNIDWKIGLETDVSPTSLLYATVQTGSEPGTLDAQNAVNGKPAVTSNTKLLSFTAGSKNRFFDNRLQLNDEVYYYDYKDFLIQTLYFGSGCSGGASVCTYNAFFNPKKMVIYGNQLDVKWLVTPVDQLTVGLAYNHARTKDFITPAGFDLSGYAPIDAPDVTINAGLQHIFMLRAEGNIVLRLNSRFENGYYTDFGTSGDCVHCSTMRQKAFTRTDAALTYHSATDKWTLGLWARNLEGDAQKGVAEYLNFSPQNVSSFFVSAPRTYGLSITTRID